jgi:dihydrofolate reductase
MRKIILSLHTTLDGFVAGPNGEMDWIKLDDEMFEFVSTFTNNADVALYGRVTYEMMEAYWPKAGDKPNASKHDRDHSAWYNAVNKIVLSTTLKNSSNNKLKILKENIAEEVSRLKEHSGKNILIFGSPRAAHSLMEHNLIDEYWLFINPIILGKGIPMFANVKSAIKLKLIGTKQFPCNVIGLNYQVER